MPDDAVVRRYVSCFQPLLGGGNPELSLAVMDGSLVAVACFLRWAWSVVSLWTSAESRPWDTNTPREGTHVLTNTFTAFTFLGFTGRGFEIQASVNSVDLDVYLVRMRWLSMCETMRYHYVSRVYLALPIRT